MKFSLHIHKHDDFEDYSGGKRFRFAVVDLGKSKNYPLNYVCMLPTKIDGKGKQQSIFLKIFRDRSNEKARAPLAEAA